MKRVLLLVLLCSAFLSNAKEYSNSEAEKLISGSSTVLTDDRSGAIKFVRLKASYKLHESESLAWLKSILNTSNGDNFKLVDTHRDRHGFTHYRYKQTHHQLEVEDGVYYIHVKNNFVVSVNGEFYPSVNYPVITSSYTDLQLTNIAKQSIKNNENLWNDQILDRPVRVIVKNKSGKYRVAYKTDIYSIAPLVRKFVYIDANTGQIIKEKNRIHHNDVVGTATTMYSGVQPITADLFGSSYRLREIARGNGINTFDLNNSNSYASAVDFTDADNDWTSTVNQDNAAFDAHYGAEQTYDYFFNTFGLNSYDNSGAIINSYVHYNTNYVNAFWDGTQMTYGDGDGSSYSPLTCLDIVGHEITHAVTEHSAGLIYSYESGALNESFSDIFGVTIDFNSNPGTANYLMGDEISTTGTPFRSMSNPNAYNDPDTYAGTYWHTASSDNGGVHTNSGVQNYWYYLLVNGGTGTNDIGNSFSVNGQGFTSAAAIAYRNLTTYLTPSSQYADARFYAIQSAIDLYGNCSPEVIATTNAWHAVGVGAVYSNSVIADFTADLTFSCVVPAIVSFTNNSINGSSYIWNFGDGSTSTAVNPTYSYSSSGVYTVSLNVTGAATCGTNDTLTITDYITVTNAGGPISSTCSPVSTNPGTLGMGIFNFSFNTINNTTASGIDDYQDYTCSHATTVTEGVLYPINITTGSGYTENADVWIDYNNDGQFNMTNEHIFNSDGVLQFHSGDILISDGAVLNTPLRMRVGSDHSTNVFANSCTNSEYGQYEDYSITILQNTNSPSVDFVADDTIVNVGQVINLTDLTQNLPTSWSWTFTGANVTSSTIQNPTVTYNSTGVYPIKLVATNSYGTDSLIKLTYINVINEYSMCGGTDTTNAIAGQLFDSGGATGNYGSNENCSFLINPGCAIDITLTFNSFYSPTSSDQLVIYDGSDATGTILGSYTYISSVPTTPVVATSGSMFITFVSNSSGNYSGFDAEWTSTITNTAPTANYSISDLNPPLNSPVQFTDLSTNYPGIWSWNFGDGTTISNIQNPSHTYVNSGSYSVTLIVDNCFTTDTLTQVITVQSAPIINVIPNPVVSSVNCGDSIVVPLTIYNTGSGDLVYDILGNESQSTGQIDVLALTYGTDLSTEYPNTIAAINQSFTNYNLTEVNTTSASVLETALQGQDVFLIPEQENGAPSVFSGFASILQDFVNNGGSVIFCGTGDGNQDCIFNTGLFSGNFISYNNSAILNLVEPSHPLANLITPPVSAVSATFYYNITNTDATTILNYNSSPIVTYREVGNGKVILIGFDYYNTNSNLSQIIGNAVQWAGISDYSDWISLSQLSDTVVAGDSSIVNITLDASNLFAGTYYDTLTITSNDLTNTPLLIPISFTVNGQAALSFQNGCFDLGTAMNGVTNSDTLTLNNDGCDTLYLTDLVPTNSDWTLDTTQLYIPPFSSYDIVVSFSPTSIGTYTDSLLIFNSHMDTMICLNGIGVGAPILTFDPSFINDTIFSCNDSIVIPITVYNTGQGELNSTLSLGTINTGNNSYFFDGFEDGTYSNWNVQNSSNAYSISSTSSATGSKSLSILGSATTGLQHTFSADTVDYFSIKLKTDAVSGTSNYCYVGNAIQSYGIATIYHYGNNTYRVNSNSAYTYTITNPWTHFELKNINYTTHLYDLYIDGVLQEANKPFNTSVNNMSSVQVFNYDNTYPGYYDDVQIGALLSPEWLATSIDTLSIPIGDSIIFDATLYADELNSGTYTSNIIYNSNDPLNLLDTLPVQLTIIGSPELAISDSCLHFGSIMENTTIQDSVMIYNTGCDTLFITNITTGIAEYTTNLTTGSILPGDSLQIVTTFSPTSIGTHDSHLTIANSDSDTTICLTGIGTGAPILTFDPSFINDTIFSCNDSIVIPITVYNTGQGELNSTLTLGTTNIGNDNYFFDGFEDGTYSNWNVQNSSNAYSISSTSSATGSKSLSILGSATTGLQHTFSADTVDYFSIKLKTDAVSGTSNYCYVGNAIQSYGIATIYHYGNNTYRVNSNSAYTYTITNPWTHFELKNINYTTHLYDLYIDGVLQEANKPFNTSVNNMSSVQVFNYDNTYPGYYDDVQIGALLSPEWLATSIDTLSIPIGDSIIFDATLYADELNSGTYTSNIIYNSNDPLNLLDTLPVQLTIIGSPELAISDSCLHFGSIMENTTIQDSIMIYNTGCDTLFITNITTGVTEYTTNLTNASILPGDSIEIVTTFSPTSIGNFDSHLTISNSDSDTTICLTANATIAPVIVTDPTALNITVAACQDSVYIPLTIYNQGGGTLDWDLISTTNISDDFNLGTNNSLWSSILGGTSANACGSAFGANALYFNGSTRRATTYDLNTSTGGDISFYLKFGTGNSPCEDADSGEDVVLEYSVNNGSTWNTINTYYTYNYSTFTLIEESIPLAAQTANTQFRWRQISFSGSGYDNWSIDEVNILQSLSYGATPNTGNTNGGDSTMVTLAIQTSGLLSGIYDNPITINSNDPLNQTLTVPFTLTISNDPCADFTYVIPSNCSGGVQFSDTTLNSPTSWQWNFGDGATSNLQNPTHIYTSVGTYTVQLIACNPTSCDTITHTFDITGLGGPTLNCTPSSISTSTNYGITNVTLNTINNTSLSSSQGYQDFTCINSTTLINSTDYILSITTDNTNAKNIKVWIDLDNNGTFTLSELVFIGNNSSSPHIGIINIPSNAVTNLPLRMRVATDNSNYSAPEPCTNVNYGEFEDYTVIIESDIVPPIAHASSTKLNPCQGIFQFTDISTGTPTSWLWNFGDGSTSIAQNPIHTYVTPGTYIVTLTASNNFGSDDFTTSVTYFELVVSEIQILSSLIDNQPILFHANSPGAISWQWVFGDGNTSNLQTPSHTYSNPGEYIVNLNVTNVDGCYTSISDTIYIESLGIDNKQSNFSIYPNPNQGIINIVNSNTVNIDDIIITNLLGEIIYNFKNDNSKIVSKQITLTDVSTGIYFVRVKFKDDEIVVTKIVITEN